jgi:hypothetical protein
MSPPRNTPNLGPNSLANEEARMRQALGLRNAPSGGSGGQVPQRREGEQRGRRFVKDGEVPVVVVNSSSREFAADGAAPVNRIAAAETALRAERTAREQAERSLAEAQSTLQHLRTQLVHADMAHREALAAANAAREQAEQALHEASEARAAAEARVADLEAAPRIRRPRPEIVMATHRPGDIDGSAPDQSAPLRRRGRKPKLRIEPAVEQEPVQWWLPTFRAGRNR